MHRALLALALLSCAHPAPVSTSHDDTPSAPLQPTRVQLRDSRAKASGTELRDALKGRVLEQLEQLGVPVVEESELVMEIDLVGLETVMGRGAPLSCAKFVGRVVRGGQAFMAVDTPSERCSVEANWALATDLSVMKAAADPNRKFTPEAQLIVDALHALVIQLAPRCR